MRHLFSVQLLSADLYILGTSYNTGKKYNNTAKLKAKSGGKILLR